MREEPSDPQDSLNTKAIISTILNCRRKGAGVGEMNPLLECLPHTYEDLNADSHYPHKSQAQGQYL